VVGDSLARRPGRGQASTERVSPNSERSRMGTRGVAGGTGESLDGCKSGSAAQVKRLGQSHGSDAIRSPSFVSELDRIRTGNLWRPLGVWPNSRGASDVPPRPILLCRTICEKASEVNPGRMRHRHERKQRLPARVGQTPMIVFQPPYITTMLATVGYVR
jgi:hypothetical protein